MQPKVPFELPTPGSHTREQPSQATTPARHLPRPLHIIRDVLIVIALNYTAMRMIHFDAARLTDKNFMLMLSVVNVLSMAIGFFLVAYLVRTHRFWHFFIVFVGVWLSTFANLRFLNGAPIVLVLTALASGVLIAFAALVGGASGAIFFKPRNTADSTRAPQQKT